MEINFTFQHALLKLPELHKLGIRSVVWLEEVIADPDSQFVDITEPGDKNPIHVAVGFSKNSLPIKYVFERENDIIRSLYARLASKEEVITEFCKFCRKQ